MSLTAADASAQDTAQQQEIVREMCRRDGAQMVNMTLHAEGTGLPPPLLNWKVTTASATVAIMYVVVVQRNRDHSGNRSFENVRL